MQEMVRRAQHGDQEAFIALMERHQQALWRAAMATLKNPDDAADAMQETVLEAWKNLRRLTEETYLSTWLTRILLYNCYDILRRRKRETPVEQWPETGKTQERDEALDVRKAMGVLAKNDRLLLTLFYCNDLPVKQIARILDIREGAVRVRLVRARERFRAVYEQTERSGEHEAI